jgi:hypothetical protein
VSDGAFLVPDTLDIVISSDPGIEVIPGILQLNGGGGGFSNLAATINGDYKVVPPFALNIKTRVSLFEILKGNNTMQYTANSIASSAKPEIGYGPFKVAPTQTSWKVSLPNYKGVDLSLYTSLSLIPGFMVIEASGSMYAGVGRRSERYESARFEVDEYGIPHYVQGGAVPCAPYTYFDFFGEIKGKVQIPRILGIGPTTIVGAGLAVSNRGLDGESSVLDIFTVHYSYEWGGKPKF